MVKYKYGILDLELDLNRTLFAFLVSVPSSYRGTLPITSMQMISMLINLRTTDGKFAKIVGKPCSELVVVVVLYDHPM